MRASLSLLLSLVLAPSGALAQRLGPRDVDTLPSVAPRLVARYGADSLQFGELRLPAGAGPFPVAVVVHGGCWTKGFATLRNTAALASALLEDGIATWNVEYRQVRDPGGGWPGTFLDVAAGIDHLRALAKDHPLDLSRVALVGHSAGAHLVLWGAARARLAADSPIRGGADPLRVRAAVAIDGPGDLAAIVGRDERICGSPVVTAFMGGTPAAEPARYRQGSPRALLPIGPAQYLVASAVLTADEARAYEAAARAAGDSVAVLAVTGAGHFGVIAPGHAAWPSVRDVIRRAVGMPPR